MVYRAVKNVAVASVYSGKSMYIPTRACTFRQKHIKLVGATKLDQYTKQSKS